MDPEASAPQKKLQNTPNMSTVGVASGQEVYLIVSHQGNTFSPPLGWSKELAWARNRLYIYTACKIDGRKGLKILEVCTLYPPRLIIK